MSAKVASRTFSTMNITIFGASRGVGFAAAQDAAKRGHRVTTVARSAGANARQSGEAIVGNVLDGGVIAQALTGADAVLVALGTGPSTRGEVDICSRGTRLILAAMNAAGLRRIAVVSSYGIGPTRDRRPFPFNVVAATLLKGVMADKEIQEREVRASSTEWTIAQPLGLTDGPASGKAFVDAAGSRKLTRVARADVAAVCIDALERGLYVHQTIAISTSP